MIRQRFNVNLKLKYHTVLLGVSQATTNYKCFHKRANIKKRVCLLFENKGGGKESHLPLQGNFKIWTEHFPAFKLWKASLILQKHMGDIHVTFGSDFV